jgi:uncharacterized cupredoxin-like copper-binding protein
VNAPLRFGAAVFVAAAVTAGGHVLIGPPQAPSVEALGPEPVTVVVDIEHSRFEPSHLTVKTGTEVRFVLRNGDPIGHELIVGPPEVHDRHRTGTHASHPAVPGELSVGPDGQGVTSYVFAAAGTVEMACHLPGHYEHGMHGEIEVVDEEPSR